MVRRFAGLFSRVSLPRDVVLTLVGALIGAGISHLYYGQSLSDLKADAEQRSRVEQLILRGIESVGTIRYQQDAAGKVTGVMIDLAGAARGEAAASGSLSSGDVPKVKQ